MSSVSPEQCEAIYEDMRNGLLLPEITEYTLSQCIEAIRSLDDATRGTLVDDWLIAVSSKYSYLLMADPVKAPTYKLIIETAKTLAKSFGEDAAAKRKGVGRSIYIRRLDTKRVAAVVVESGQNLGPKASGVHVGAAGGVLVDAEMVEQINAEVIRQLEAQSPLPPTTIEFPIERAPESGLPVAALRTMITIPPNPLADLPLPHLLPDITVLLTHASQLLPFEEDEGADFTATIHDDPREHWASSRGRAPVRLTFEHPNATHIPMTPTGRDAEIKQLSKQAKATRGLEAGKHPMSIHLQKAAEARANKASAKKLLEKQEREAYAEEFPANNAVLEALGELI